MRIRACVKCDTPLEDRAVTIGDRTFTIPVRVCTCVVLKSGWYWRRVSDPPGPEEDIPAWKDVPA